MKPNLVNHFLLHKISRLKILELIFLVVKFKGFIIFNFILYNIILFKLKTKKIRASRKFLAQMIMIHELVYFYKIILAVAQSFFFVYKILCYLKI